MPDSPPNSVDIATLCVAFFTLIASGIGIWYTVKFARKANKTNVLFSVFTEFRNKEWVEVRADLTAVARGEKALAFEDYRNYCYFLNHIGMLLDRGYVEIDDLYQMAGDSITETWQLLKDDILTRRVKQRRYFLFHLQYLAAELAAYRRQGDDKIDKLIANAAAKLKT